MSNHQQLWHANQGVFAVWGKVSGYGFNGEYYDAATGMLNLRARQYEPGQARFSQRDIERGEAANAVSLNRYAFTWNDPVNLVDASGEKPEVVRNSITVDPGGGGSSARIANEAQSKAAPKKVTTASSGAVGAGHLGNKLTNRERILFDNPEEAARIRYAKKQSSSLTVDSAINRYLCTAISEGFSDPLWVRATGASSEEEFYESFQRFMTSIEKRMKAAKAIQEETINNLKVEDNYIGIDLVPWIDELYNAINVLGMKEASTMMARIACKQYQLETGQLFPLVEGTVAYEIEYHIDGYLYSQGKTEYFWKRNITTWVFSLSALETHCKTIDIYYDDINDPIDEGGFWESRFFGYKGGTRK